MEFHDVLHGRIQLGLPFNTSLIEELFISPEVSRLRNMRLMNFDVPLIQELASAKRLSHSVGVCYLAQEVAKRSLSDEKSVSTIMVAALLHDAAIPPYGHLVEAMLRKKHHEFDHSRVLRDLLYGTYHETNVYHQIVPSDSLKLQSILEKHRIDLEEVLELVQPSEFSGSAISARVDLDNIDNVHRMACLIGWQEARENLRKIVDNSRIVPNFRLEFTPKAIDALRFWQDLRQRLYTLIIAHPESVAQNAFQSDIVKEAIRCDLITPEDWFINEPFFEERLRNNKNTRQLARQLISGSRYRLVDYVWFTHVGTVPCQNWTSVFEDIEDDLPKLRRQETYFSWVEANLISRTIDILLTNGETKHLGERSFSCLIARIHTDTNNPKGQPLTKNERWRWRAGVMDVFAAYVSKKGGSVLFPEDYTGSYFQVEDGVRQYELY